MPGRPPVLRTLVVAALACLLAPACRPRDLDAVGRADTPVVFLLSPAHGRHVEPARLEALGRFLRDRTGLEVDVWVAPTDDAAIHAVGADRADVALLPLHDYLFLNREYGARAELRVLRADGEQYGGEILARADGDITTLEQLDGRKVAFVAPWSTTGFILPARMLADRHVRPEAIMTGSHQATLALLRAGQADAAVTFAGAATADPTLRVIATTPRVPNEPVFFRRSLAPAKRKALADALVAFAATAEGASLLEDIAGITGLVPTSDAAYGEAVHVLKQAGTQLEDLVADGWRIANANRLPLSSYAP